MIRTRHVCIAQVCSRYSDLQMLEGDIWAWSMLPDKLVRWAWRSRGSPHTYMRTYIVYVHICVVRTNAYSNLPMFLLSAGFCTSQQQATWHGMDPSDLLKEDMSMKGCLAKILRLTDIPSLPESEIPWLVNCRMRHEHTSAHVSVYIDAYVM